jgi:hypothetical protein
MKAKLIGMKRQTQEQPPPFHTTTGAAIEEDTRKAVTQTMIQFTHGRAGRNQSRLPGGCNLL